MTRLAILSDVHANIEALQAVLHDIETRSADRIVCLGDIVGYNADPAACVSLLRDSGAMCVAGNHDRAVCGQIPLEEFGIAAARAIAWTRARLDDEALAFLAQLPAWTSVAPELVAVHGGLHVDGAWETVRLDTDQRRLSTLRALTDHPSGARICAVGHTHLPGYYVLQEGRFEELVGEAAHVPPGAFYLVNPGAVGQPRQKDRRATYMVLDLERKEIALRRVGYDAAAVRCKARRAGLSPAALRLPGPVRNWVMKGLEAMGLRELVRDRLIGSM